MQREYTCTQLNYVTGNDSKYRFMVWRLSMNKFVYILFLLSSTVVAMERALIDPALVPTYEECKIALETIPPTCCHEYSEELQLVKAFAQYGPIGQFNRTEYHTPDFADNELLSWAISAKSAEMVKILIARSIAQSVSARNWRRHIRTALEGLQEGVAAQLLVAKPDIGVNEGIWDATLLQTAAHNLCSTFAKTVLEGNFGAQVDACSENFKKTPLQLCAEATNNHRDSFWMDPNFSEKKRDMLHLLLKHRANHEVTITLKIEGGQRSASPAYTKSFLEWCSIEKFDDCLVPLVEQKKINGCTPMQAGLFLDKEPLLNWAVRVGSLPLVQAIVPARSKSNGLYLDNTALRAALRKNHKDIVTHLATHPFTERRKSTGQEVARVAVENGWLETMQNVVAYYGKAILTGEDDWYRKMALLHSASKRGDVPMMRMLLDVGCDMHETDTHYATPCEIAVHHNKPNAVGILLAQGAYEKGNASALACNVLESVDSSDEKKLGPLDQSDTLDQLFAYGADIQSVRLHCVARHGETPLEYVMSGSSANKYHLVVSLLAAGMDPNDYRKKSPLCYAVERNDSELVALLLRHGADPERVFKQDSTAAYYVSADILSALLNAGLQIQEDQHGLTPLLHAVSGNTPEAVACLLDKGGPRAMQEVAYTLISHNDGPDITQTLFEYAVHQNRKNPAEVCQLLLDRGADLERVNELGETPVFWALRNCNAAALEWLVAHGARLDVVNAEGETPLSFLACQPECTQSEMLTAALTGLSASAGGLVSVADALEHSEKWRSDPLSTAQQVALWKQSMKFDPFEKVREYCGNGLHKKYVRLHVAKPTLDTRLKEIEQDICKHGAFLLSDKMKRAFESNDIETVRQFIATGIDLRFYDLGYGETVLHWAARHRHLALLIELLAKEHGLKEVINRETTQKRTALSESDTVGCARVLIESGAAITKNVMSQLVYKDNDEVVRYILSKFDPAVCTPADIQEIYESAVRYGNTLLAQKCLELGANPQEYDLELAVHAQHVDIVTLLKSKGISVVTAQKKARERQYCTTKSFAEVAVEKKNLALLGEVIETADASLLPIATYCSWDEGLAVLLKHYEPQAFEDQSNLLSEAIRVRSLDCCKLLIEHHVPVIFEHLDHAIDATHEIMQFLLQHAHTSQHILDRLLYRAIKKLRPALCVVLLEHGANLSAVDTKKHRTWFHIVAGKAYLFGLSSYHGDSHYHPAWQERVKNIEWLNAYKQHILEGNESLEALKAPDEDVQDLVDTLYVLMTAPVYISAQEHKEVLYRLLQKRWSCEFDADKELTPFAFAQMTCNSSTFNDLLDPEKIKQWYAAIDRAYAQRDAKQTKE